MGHRRDSLLINVQAIVQVRETHHLIYDPYVIVYLKHNIIILRLSFNILMLAGKYSSSYGLTSVTMCITCPSGYYNWQCGTYKGVAILPRVPAEPGT